jgi:hypothetical protein
VKLTWDDDDPERHQVTRRALTKREIEQGDFGNYVAGSSAESSSDSQCEDEGGSANRKGNQKWKGKGKKDKKAERDKLRALLLSGNGDEMPEGWGAGDEIGNNNLDDVDMEITFMPALSKKVGGEDETTLERYQRRVREKRKKRKEERVKGEEGEKARERDEFFEASGGSDGNDREEGGARKGKKTRPNDKERDKVDDPPREEATAAELALLVASDEPTDEPTHFNIKSVIKAERAKKGKGRGKGKKGKRGGMEEEDNEAQEDFVMNVKDERFKVLFEDHQFAVDPSNPQYVFISYANRTVGHLIDFTLQL